MSISAACTSCGFQGAMLDPSISQEMPCPRCHATSLYPSGAVPEAPPKPDQSLPHYLTAFLLLLILAYSVSPITYLAFGRTGPTDATSFPSWYQPLMASLAAVDVLLVIAMFFKKRWAFYVYGAVSLIGSVINLATGGTWMQSLFMCLPVLILFALLQGGRPHSTWTQMGRER